MAVALFVNCVVTMLIRTFIGRFLYRSYSPIFARLASYGILFLYDIPSSFIIHKIYMKGSGDRRKNAVPFERYIVVRGLAAATSMLGVILGYMLEYEENGH